MVSLLVFCQQNEMPAAFVYSIVFLQVKIALGAIDFAAENGLKLFFFRLPFVDFIAVVEEFFDAEHVAVVPGEAFGPGGKGFVRCCYATSADELREALKRIKRFMDKQGAL